MRILLNLLVVMIILMSGCKQSELPMILQVTFYDNIKHSLRPHEMIIGQVEEPPPIFVYLVRVGVGESFTIGVNVGEEFTLRSISYADTMVAVSYHGRLGFERHRDEDLEKNFTTTFNIGTTPRKVNDFRRREPPLFEFQLVATEPFEDILRASDEKVIDVTEIVKPYTWEFERVEYLPNGKPRKKWVEKYNSRYTLERHGKYQEFYPSGSLKVDGEYVKNHRHGLFHEFYENGNIKAENKYVQNKLEGVSCQYYQSGKLLKKLNYVDGNPDGTFQEWHENGQLKIDGSFVSRTRDGLWKFYDSLGSMEYYGDFILGTGTLFYDDNLIRSTEQSDNMKPYGNWNCWWPNGNVRAVLNHKNHGINYYKEDGTPFFDPGMAYRSFYPYVVSKHYENWPVDTLRSKMYSRNQYHRKAEFDADSNLIRITEWYENGQKLDEIEYRNGIQHGHAYTWSPEGVLIKEFYYENGKPTGTWRYFTYQYTLLTERKYRSDSVYMQTDYYNNSHVRKSQGKYLRDKKDSTWTYWDIEGNIVRTENWVRGELDQSSPGEDK